MVIAQITDLELAGFVVVSGLGFLLGCLLTALSYGAYRRTERRSLRPAILGFGVLAVGTSIQSVYQIGIKGSFTLGPRELFLLEGLEASLLVVSFLLLTYSVTKY